MAGHSQFKNIMYRKGAQDKRRSKLFSKIGREITVAAKTGLPDPDHNPRLRSAIQEARVNNMPKDRIERAIKKSTEAGGDDYEDVRYEGFASGGVGVIVEVLTDNRNRSASEVRALFSRHGGALGETGSASFMFDRLGSISFSKESISDIEAALEEALRVGAQDCVEEEEGFLFLCDASLLHATQKELEEKLGESLYARLIFRPTTPIEINDNDAQESLLGFIEALEDNDDVQNVWVNASFSDTASGA